MDAAILVGEYCRYSYYQKARIRSNLENMYYYSLNNMLAGRVDQQNSHHSVTDSQ